MPSRWYNDFTFRHDKPEFVDRIERAVKAERLLDEFVPEPRSFSVPYKPAQTGDEFWDRLRDREPSRLAWRSDFWGTCWDIKSDQIERQGDRELRVEFRTGGGVPIPVLDRLLELDCSVSGKYYDDACMFARLYDNGVITDDPNGGTIPQLNAQGYLDECAKCGDTPALDESSVPDHTAVHSHFNALDPDPLQAPVNSTYFERLAQS